MKRSREFMFDFIICVVMGLFYSVKSLIAGSSLVARLFDTAIYALFIWSLFCSHTIMCGIIFIYLGLALVFTFWLQREKMQDDTSNTKTERCNGTVNIFYGMSETDAKVTYRRLLKQYHPDSSNGDIDMTRKIIEDYRVYSASRM